MARRWTRRTTVALLAAALLAVGTRGQGDFAELDPDYEGVTEDPAYDPYKDKTHFEAELIEPQVRERARAEDPALAAHEREVDQFDFDPSEGLTFLVPGKDKACFFEDVKFEGDEIGGAFVVASADSHIDLEVGRASLIR